MSLPDSNTSDTPDYDVDVQPQDLSRRMQHLSNVLNHFWKRWRNEYLIELRNTHRYLNQNDTIKTVSVGDVVVVHEEDQPRGKWRVAKILDLIVGSDGCTCLDPDMFPKKKKKKKLYVWKVQMKKVRTKKSILFILTKRESLKH